MQRLPLSFTQEILKGIRPRFLWILTGIGAFMLIALRGINVSIGALNVNLR